MKVLSVLHFLHALSVLTHKSPDSREQITSVPHRPIYFQKADAPSFPTIYGSKGCRAHPGPTIGRSSAAITTVYCNSVQVLYWNKQMY